MKLDLVFPVRGDRLPIDHCYPLYGALSRIVPSCHEVERKFAFQSIPGKKTGEGELFLDDLSCLRLRVSQDSVRHVLPLAGKKLDLNGYSIRLGVPSLQVLLPSESVTARVVTFKNADSPEEFLTTARVKLEELGVTGEAQLPIHLDGDRAGEPKRRVVRIKGVTIYGYALLVSALSPGDSITLQEHGLGGRTRMGCGFFTPVREAQ